MSRLTLRLPETLHQHLIRLADNEGISLNQYIVYALTRQATLSGELVAMPQSALDEQRAAFAGLLERLGTASPGQIRAALDARDPASDEAELSPEIVERLRRRLPQHS